MATSRARWSWATSESEADEFRAEARGLVGEQLAEVRYVTLDYRSDDFRGTTVGPRVISSADEWVQPSWRHPACDTVDHAVELQTASGRHFTASWESPGRIEGLGLRELPAIGAAVLPEGQAAIWVVSTEPGWRNLIGQTITSAELRYEPWEKSGALWCRRIDLRVDDAPVVLILAEGRYGADDMAPSADNVAVLFREVGNLPWTADEVRGPQ